MGKRTIIYDGKAVDVPDPNGDLWEQLGLPPERNIYQRTANGYDLVPKGKKTTINDRDEFFDTPGIIKGGWLYDWLTKGEEQQQHRVERRPAVVRTIPLQDVVQRRKQEIALVAHDFPQSGIECDRDIHYIIFHRYQLPERWGSKVARLMVLLGPQYPWKAPIGFYLNENLPLKNGQHDSHFIGQGYHGAPDLRPDWYWYCSFVGGSWLPNTNFRRADNLRSVMGMVQSALVKDS